MDTEKKSNGALVGSVVVIIIIIIGGIYFWKTKVEDKVIPQDNEIEQTQNLGENATLEDAEQVLEQIEQEIQTDDVQNLDLENTVGELE